MVELEPTDDSEHIDDLRDPSDEGEEGGVWKVKLESPEFLERSRITCSEAGGSLNGSSLFFASFFETSSNCWNSETRAVSSSKKGFRQTGRKKEGRD